MSLSMQHFPDGPSSDSDEFMSNLPLDGPANGIRDVLQPYTYKSIYEPSQASTEAFMQLPTEVIQRILWIVDSNVFASISILNRQWYKEAQRPELYAHHLSRCPSYALSNNVITGPFRRFDLFRLKTKFAAEVRRNLFEAYMRPRETSISLISRNVSSSAAFPGGEALRFAFSPNGHTVLALSSSRIYVLDVSTDDIEVRKELKTLRRPLAASITDDASLLAVLSSKHQANIYGLTPTGVKHLQVLVLDKPPRTIALAHEGTVLAAAYEGGVEVFSLASNALSTDRRAVRSEAVDTLTFSGDGSMLVGSSQSLEEPNAVVITAPFYTENDPDMSSREIHSRMWTTQILFPQISSICSHAELLQGHMEGDASWLFAYDHTLMSYRAVRTDDTRTGVAYFLNPATSRRYSMPVPSTAPTASACGTLVVAGFAGSGLFLYGVPERLDISPDMGSVVERQEKQSRGQIALTSATGMIEPLMAYSPSISGTSEEIEDDSLAGKVDWRQSLFIKCRQLNTIDGYTATKWVERSEARPCKFPGKRLVVVAPGGVNAYADDLGEEGMPMPVDGSRICLLDFDYSHKTEPNRVVKIEVGEEEPQLLTEHTGTLDIEVAMERRRTVRGETAKAAPRVSLGRSNTAASPLNDNYFRQGLRPTSISQPSSPSEGLDESLARTPPTVQRGLQRSATAAGFQSARYPPRPPLGSNLPQSSGHVIYHRPNGRRDSAESWESPPPPYSNNPQTGVDQTNFIPPWGGALQQRRSWIESSQHPLSGSTGSPNGTSHSPQSQFYRNQQGFEAAQSGQTMMQYVTPTHGWPKPLGGSNLETVSEFGAVHQASRSVQLAPGGAPVAVSSAGRQHLATRRPLSYDGRSANEQQFAPRSIITHPIAPQTPNRDAQVSHSTQHHETTPSSASSITLTGANLQNRLNLPVPPTPNSMEQPRGGESGGGGTVSPQQSSAASFPRVHPTADQMENLRRRMSQTRARPLSVVTTGSQSMTSASRDFGRVPPSPPRAAWGAAGVPGSPSFNKARNSPNGLSRNNSKGSQRSIPISASVPNLHAAQRPKYGRLDTIESVSTVAGTGEGGGGLRSRAHSLANDISTAAIHEQAIPADGRRIVTDPVLDSGRRKGKKKNKGGGGGGGGGGDGSRPQTALGGEVGGGSGAREKKGSRCVVM